jgi:hypothetical protein
MEVKFFNPSELDATVETSDNGMVASPRFYTPAGPAVLGTLLCQDERGSVLDRVVLQVSGKGKISVIHRNEVVKPLAEQERDIPVRRQPAEKKKDG